MFDVVIIGAGAAGMSAALWCDELGLKTLLLEAAAEFGGQLTWVYNSIENHLGTTAANGRDLQKQFIAQIERRGFERRTNAEVSAINLIEKSVTLNDRFLTARALVLATGVRRRTLGVPGETRFENRGILTSGKRDAATVAGKTVCIVGGGDAACENALILSETAAQVYLVHRRREFRARRKFLDRIAVNPKVKVLTETEVLRIAGRERVESIELRRNDSSEIFAIAADAVLPRIGVAPNTGLFADQLATDRNGYVLINSLGETDAENVFAIGDVSNPLAPTVSGAVGAGATAAKVLAERLKSG